LFLAFADDAALVENQWWEGQAEFSDYDGFDTKILRGVVAFQVARDVEVGGRVGFGDTDVSGPGGGSGATDLDLWGKYYLGQAAGATEFAVGGILTVPTGDDTAGLGLDAFSLAAFGALRHRMNRAILAAHAGVRLNGDGSFLGSPELEGKASAIVGAGWIVPVSDQVSFVAELNLESKRFEGGDTDARLLGGVNWRIANQGTVRGAVSVGLDDGAPDTQLIGAYVYSF
jgi:hypothetical protein